MDVKKLKFATRQIHAGLDHNPATGSRGVAIYPTAAYRFNDCEHAANLFKLSESGNIYTRLQNPTTSAYEERISALYGGVGALGVASGMSAILIAITSLAQAGDNIVASPYLYGGTYNLFRISLRKLGIEVRIPASESPDDFASQIDDRTRALFVESMGNPTCAVPDLEGIAKVAHDAGVPLIVDNTFPTPINCRPFEWGADIVVHSTTKYMDGHATSVGGAIVDSGNFDWDAHADKFPGLCTPDESYHGLTYTKAFGKMAYITKATAQLMRDLGSIQSPQNAFLLNLGLETLHLRVPQHCRNAQAVAEYLSTNDKVAWVNYCGLSDNKYNALARKYMPGGSCGVVSFGLKGGRDVAIRFMDNLKLAAIVTHVADARTCVLHPASHTHRQLTDEQLLEAGVRPDLIRFSVGIENADDIIADIAQALDK